MFFSKYLKYFPKTVVFVGKAEKSLKNLKERDGVETAGQTGAGCTNRMQGFPLFVMLNKARINLIIVQPEN